MPHSHYLMVPISGQGIIVDPGTKTILQRAMRPPFDYTDVFLYSHGWWTRAEAAMVDYNRFLMGLSPVVIEADAAAGIGPRASLGLGLHWPSMVSEDANSPLSALQPFTYFNRAKMADVVGENGGYSLLRILLEAREAGRPLPRFYLTGHSFGCKVVCAALEQLAATLEGSGALAEVEVRLVLLQGAFDFDELEPGRSYGRLFSAFPGLRVLATKSALDKAVAEEYEAVQRVMNLFHGATATPGLGAVGPSEATAAAAGGVTAVAVGPGYRPTGPFTGRLVVADLEPLHAANPAGDAPFSGHHSDIFLDEVYRLMAAFFLS